MAYKVFTRNWWINNPAFPNGLQPHMGRKTILRASVDTEDEARRICAEYNDTHKPGRLSRKAEYESIR